MNSGSSLLKILALVVVVGFLSCAPCLLSTHWVIILTEILIMSIYAMSFNLLFGYTGLLSFGQAGFFGVGAYLAVLFVTHVSSSLWLTLLAGVAGAALVSLVIGWFCVRLDEIYFAILTLGFGMMLYTVAHNWRDVTGGSDGLTLGLLPPISLYFVNIELFNPRYFYWLTLGISLLAIIFLRQVVFSPFGLLLTATRENSQRVSFVGSNIRSVRLYAFVIAGSLSGLAGILFALFNRIAAPEMLHWSFSGKAVLMTILGGSGTFLGPVVGTGIFFILEHFITSYTNNWMIFLGATLVAMVLVFPRGVLGSSEYLLSKLKGGSANE
jgi:branched-chain amino acid transport system permease protein